MGLLTYASLVLALTSPVSSTVMAANSTNVVQTKVNNNNKKATKSISAKVDHITPTIDWSKWTQSYRTNVNGNYPLDGIVRMTDKQYSPGKELGDMTKTTLKIDRPTPGQAFAFSTYPKFGINYFKLTDDQADNLQAKSDFSIKSDDGTVSETVPMANIVGTGSNNRELDIPLDGSKLEYEKTYNSDFIYGGSFKAGATRQYPTIRAAGDVYETQMVKVMYLNAANGNPIRSGLDDEVNDYLGEGLGPDDKVSAEAQDLTNLGYTYTNSASLITPENTTEYTGDTVSTTLKTGDKNNPYTSTGKQVIVFLVQSKSQSYC